MDIDEKNLMEELGITAESKTIFHFDGYRYDRLIDAINYAKARPRPAQNQKIQHEN